MNPFLSTLHAKCERLHGVIIRLILAGTAACLTALAKQVRALEVRVRLWVIAERLAMETAPTRETGTRKSGHGAQGARKTSVSPLQGFRLSPSKNNSGAPRNAVDPSRQISPSDPADAEILTLIKLVGLQGRLNRLNALFDNSDAALRDLARRLRRTAAPMPSPHGETRSIHPLPTDEPTEVRLPVSSLRRLPSPDTS